MSDDEYQEMTSDEYMESLIKDLPEDLRYWLEFATSDLGRIGMKRVVEDISEHYEYTYRQALESGECPTDARESAMEVLGDHQVACRKFGEQYLTSREEGSLRTFHSAYAKIGRFSMMICFIISAGFALLFFALSFRDGQSSMLAHATFMMSTPFYFFLFRKCALRNEVQFQQYLFGFWILGFALTHAVGAALMLESIFASIPVFIFTAMFSLGQFTVARKIPRNLTRSELQLLGIKTEIAK